jgi:hypothetical protein
MSLHTVTKKFRAGNRMLTPGDIVDSTGWHNERSLVDSNFLAPTHHQVPTVDINDEESPDESKNPQEPDWRDKASRVLADRTRAWARQG